RVRRPRRAGRRSGGGGDRAGRAPAADRRRRGASRARGAARRRDDGARPMTTTPAPGTIPPAIPPSATLAINERIGRRIRDGRDVLHLAFGEAGLPVHPSVADVLARAAPRNGYGSVAGSEEARAAAAGYFERRGVPTTPEQILLSPGSKPLIYALLTVLPGDIVLPQPSWVSYAAHAALAGKRVVRVPIGPTAGGIPDPAALEEALADAGRAGARPGVLVLTLPDNPTGTQPTPALVEEVCRIAERHGLLIVADEIYRDLAFDPAAFRGPADFVPERSFVTNGLSKNMALGGWRIGFARMADGPLGEEGRAAAAGVAGAVWSALAAPMPALAEHLLERHDVGVLAGEAFGDDPSGLRVRMATSLLYGADDAERERALAAAHEDPAALSWIR